MNQVNAVSINNLSKIYNTKKLGKTFQALNELNLEIEQGVIFGLLGANGAGKSTLINILAGTVVKSFGDVKIMGYDIDKQPKTARSQLGVVPQEIALDTFFSLEKALEFTAGYYGLSPNECDIAGTLKALGLWDKRKNLPRQLSGGMKRRFLVAKAMIHKPKLLILDEPTAGVDIELRDQLWDYVKKLNQQGTTIIITTHYLAEAQILCDEIAFINKGKIIRQDSKNNLLSELGDRLIEIEFKHEVKASDINLAKKFNYQLVDANKLQINLSNNEYDYNQLLTELASLKIEIKNMHISEHDLETIFYKMLKKQ